MPERISYRINDNHSPEHPTFPIEKSWMFDGSLYTIAS